MVPRGFCTTVLLILAVCSGIACGTGVDVGDTFGDVTSQQLPVDQANYRLILSTFESTLVKSSSNNYRWQGQIGSVYSQKPLQSEGFIFVPLSNLAEVPEQ